MLIEVPRSSEILEPTSATPIAAGAIEYVGEYHHLFVNHMHCIADEQIRLQKAAQEELKRLQAIERKEHERKVREERHIVWRHRTAIRLLCTSVDSLFLFFAQRVANLAGSRRMHNDALRANGE